MTSFSQEAILSSMGFPVTVLHRTRFVGSLNFPMRLTTPLFDSISEDTWENIILISPVVIYITLKIKITSSDLEYQDHRWCSVSFWQGYLIAQARCLVSDDVIKWVLGAGQVLGEELPLLCPSFPARENDPETPIFVVCPVCKSATVKHTQKKIQCLSHIWWLPSQSVATQLQCIIHI